MALHVPCNVLLPEVVPLKVPPLAGTNVVRPQAPVAPRVGVAVGTERVLVAVGVLLGRDVAVKALVGVLLGRGVGVVVGAGAVAVLTAVNVGVGVLPAGGRTVRAKLPLLPA